MLIRLLRTYLRPYSREVAIVVVLVGLLVKEPELLLPIGPDQGTYSYVAERILQQNAPLLESRRR